MIVMMAMSVVMALAWYSYGVLILAVMIGPYDDGVQYIVSSATIRVPLCKRIQTSSILEMGGSKASGSTGTMMFNGLSSEEMMVMQLALKHMHVKLRCVQ